MDARELRIGNWLLFSNKIQPDKYINVCPKFFSSFSIENSLQVTPYYSPIPLTPEILEKAGFVGLPHFTIHKPMQISLGRDRLLSIADIGGGNEMMYVEDDDESPQRSIIIIHNRDYDGKIYLHKVQNVYKDLTGEELEITL